MNQSYYATVYDNIESQDLLLYQYLLEVGLLLLHQNQIEASNTKSYYSVSQRWNFQEKWALLELLAGLVSE